ncbi:MAG TPA: hypothetical protein VLC09_09355 [Polyangiaceae bacterium]|nr:hypothetical protein [Polyangiaceae bacterium]
MATGDRLLGDMTRPEHAYALGVIAASGRIREGVLELELRGDGQPLLGLLEARTASDIPANYELEGALLRIRGPHAGLARSLLGGDPGAATALRFPELGPRLAWAFVRGLFDASASISSPKRGRLEIEWAKPSPGLLDGVLEFVAVAPSRVKRRYVVWRDVAALDLLGQLYGEFLPEPERTAEAASSPHAASEAPVIGPYRGMNRSGAVGLYRAKHLQRFWDWSTRVSGFTPDGQSPGELHVQLVHPQAVLPRKERVSDSGYDLTLLYERSRHGNIVMYGTGVIVEPPTGWYLDVVARSSIVKRGYMLANNVGIIDRSYRGEILVPLLKTDPNAKDLELPARIAQLIPRPIVHFPVVEGENLSTTQRGAGGFGSTG